MHVQPTARCRDAGEIFFLPFHQHVAEMLHLISKMDAAPHICGTSCSFRCERTLSEVHFSSRFTPKMRHFSTRSDPLCCVLVGEKKNPKPSWPFLDASQPRNLTSEDKERTRSQPPVGGAGQESSSEVKCHRRTHKFHFKTCQLLLSFQTRPGL